MLTLTYSAEIFSRVKEFIGRAVVLSNTKNLAILAVDEDVFEELESDLTIVFFDEVKGVVTTTCSVIAYHTPQGKRDSYTFTCKVHEVLEVLQRRADVYARLSLNVEILKVKSMKNFNGNRSVHFEDKAIPVRLNNISASGMHFHTSYEMKKGSVVCFDLNKLFSNADLVMAEVLRIDNMDNKSKSEKLRGYGCRFFDMKRAIESRLRQYVFQENRKQLNARKRYFE